MGKKNPGVFVAAQEPATASHSGDRGSVDLMLLWQVLMRHRWGILGLAMGAALIAALWAFSLRPVYVATATLLIETQTPGVMSLPEVYGVESPNDEYYQTQYEILRSRALAARVVRSLGLAEHPEFRPADSAGGRWLDWRSWLPADWLPATGRPEADGDAERRERLLADFRGRLDIEPVRKSQLVKIRFSAHDPELAARVANAVAQAYIEGQLEARLEMTSSASKWLTERLAALRDKLEASEQALQAYREREKLVKVGEVATLTADQLTRLNEELAGARQRAAVSSAAYRQIQALAGQDWSRYESIPAVLNDKLFADLKADEEKAQREVDALAKRYGPYHPKMIGANTDLATAREAVHKRVRNVIAAVEKQYAVARAEVQSLERAMGSAKGEMQQINRKSYQLGVLEREVEANRQLYELFLGRFKATDETTGLQSASARVSDPAVAPVDPARPRKQLIVGLAAIGGLFLGIAFAFLMEHLDRTIKFARQVEEQLGIPALGQIPRLKLRARGRTPATPLAYASEHPRSEFAEAIRTVRTGVLLSGLDQDHQVILVTSSIPGEGKSTVASNLAVSLGEMHKVLLVDADLRRPTIATQLGLDPDTPGLAEFVSGSAPLSACVHDGGDGKVKVMPSGRVPPNPLELLSSPRFREALEKLSRTFDYVVLDSAPTLAVSDAILLATQASGVVFVVRADATPDAVVSSGLQRLQRGNARMVGVVLNQTVVGRHADAEDARYHDYVRRYTDDAFTTG